MRSRFVALGLVWGCFGLGVLAACGSDEDSSSSGGTPDASTDNNTLPGDSSTPVKPNIVAADLTVYTGMTPVVDASGTNAQTFTWTVKSAPAGSTVATATLAGATAARASFRADVSGDYVLEVTAKNGNETSVKDVKIKAVPAPLFHMQTNFAEKPAYFEYRTIGTDGTGGHPIACRVNGDPDGGDDNNAAFLFLSMLLADMGEDWWEAPPGDPSRVAFVQIEPSFDGGDMKNSLALGTNLSTCQSPPAKVDPVAEDGGINDGVTLLQPRFNRAGSRVAYLEDRESGWYVAAVSYDGKDRRDLSKMCVDEDTCNSPSVFPARPQWLDDQTVGWVRNQAPEAGTGWEIMVANDSANPNPRTYMTCDGVQPRSFAFLKDGSILANRQAADGGAREDLWILKPATAGGACTVVRNLTNLPTNRSYARDFSVSPENTDIAFVRKEEPADAAPKDGGETRFGGQVYTVPVSGASAPAPVTGSPQEALFGPRYVAGGSMLAWNGAIAHDGGNAADDGGFLDGGLPVIAVAARDGGPVSYAAKSDPDAGTYVFGGGNGGSCDFRLCSMGPMQSSGGGALAIGAVAGALALRRRRRNR